MFEMMKASMPCHMYSANKQDSVEGRVNEILLFTVQAEYKRPEQVLWSISVYIKLTCTLFRKADQSQNTICVAQL